MALGPVLGNGRWFGVRWVVILALMSGLFFLSVSCAPVDCTDGSNPLFLRTSTSQMNVRAAEAVFCPIMPGKDEQDCSTSMTYRMLRLDEMINPLATWVCMDFPYPGADIAQFFIALRSFQQSNFTCVGDVVDEILAPGVSAQVLTTSFTHPLFPDFFLQLNYSVANASVDFNQGSSEFMEGRDFIVSYRPDQIKQSMSVRGWPWVGSPAVDKSYAALYFEVIMNSEEPYTMSYNRSLEYAYVKIETSKVSLVQTLDHAAVLDGIPYFKRYNEQIYDVFEGPFSAGNASYVLGGTSSCFIGPNGGDALFKQFDELIYDPQFAVIFGEATTPTTTDTPAKKASKTAVIVGASVAAAVVVCAVIAIVLAMIYIPSFKNFVRPFARSGDKQLPQAAHIQDASNSPDTDQPLTQHSTEPTPAKNGWVKGR